MNTQKQFTGTAVVLMILICGTIWAGTMGTAFTYQGRLLDNNVAANGLYDMQFKLYDDPNVIVGSQIGSTATADDVDVADGYFIAQLDFGGAAFGGDARWLQIAVRPYDSADPNDFVAQSPLQEITPTPYAVYAESSGSSAPDSDWYFQGIDLYSQSTSGKVGIGTKYPTGKLDVDTSSDMHGLYVQNRRSDGPRIAVWGSAGVTNTTDESVGVYGRSESATGDSYGLYGVSTGNNTSNNYGVYTQAANPGSGNSYAGYFEGIGYFSGNVGIGTANPSEKLDVSGAVKVSRTGANGPLLILNDTNGSNDRPGIQFLNNNIHYIAGDDAGNEYFGFYSQYGSSRTNDAVVNIHGKASNWNTYLQLTHNGTDGVIGTDTGSLILSPNQNVRVGTSGTVDHATAAGDLYVEDVLEVDGNAEVGGTVNADNMPGCEYSTTTWHGDVPTTWTNLKQVSLTLNAPGYVIVTFSGYAIIGLDMATVYLGISTTTNSADTTQACSGLLTTKHPFSVQHVYTVSSAGTYTYYGNAKSSAGSGSTLSEVYQAHITAIYVPNKY